MRAKNIRELVKIVEESNIGELEIGFWWGRRIRISKNAAQISAPRVSTLEMPPTATAPSVVKTEASAEVSTLVEIKAPMVGTFYCAPAPDADPYVKEGDMIAPGKVLCIIEAMKLMNEIEAEISGKIVKNLIENAKPVEYNQPLFLVEPS